MKSKTMKIGLVLALVTLLVGPWAALDAQDASQCDARFQTPAGDVVGYWTFNDNTNPVRDDYDGYHGVNQGATWVGSGAVGGALSFDGLNDYVNLSDPGLNVPAWDSYTISVWFLNDGGGDHSPGYGQKIIDKTTWYSDFYLSVIQHDVGQLVFKTYAGGSGALVDDSHDYRDNQWHHAVVVKDGAHGELWVDGGLKDTTQNIKTVNNAQPLLLGYSMSGDGYQRKYWSGKIDELIIFDRPLTGCEAQLLHATSAAGHHYCCRPWIERDKITAADGVAGDAFSWGLAIDGDTAVVGAFYDDDKGTDSGSAYVFERSGNAWVQQAKLTAADGSAGDQFGVSAAIGGDTIVVGANLHNSSQGAVYVFVRSGNAWVSQAKLTASDGVGGDLFGGKVAIDGDTAVIGAPGFAGQRGAAYVFVRSGTTWTQQAKLVASDGSTGERFSNNAVAIDGDTALFGAERDTTGGIGLAGSAYVFVRTGTTWSQQAKLVASDISQSKHFGVSVALSGDTALVGCHGCRESGTDAGAAYVYQRAGTSWPQQAKLVPADNVASDRFGVAVGLSGDTAVIGAFNDDDGATNAGSAYVYQRSGTSWSEEAKLLASDSAEDDYFGWFLAFDGATAVIGAPLDDDKGTDSGSAYLFSTNAAPELTVALATVGVDEGQTATNTGTFSDADCDDVGISASVGTITQDTGSGGNWEWSFDTQDGPSDSQTVTITASDGHGGTGQTTFVLSVDNVAPSVTIDQIVDETGNVIGVDVDVVLVGLTVHVEGSFSDPGLVDTHTARVDWDDGSPVEQLGAVTGDVEAEHKYTAEGTFTVELAVEDKDGGEGTATADIIVVDPAGAADDSINDLGELLDDPAVNEVAAEAVQDAIDGLAGDSGGQAENGVLDKLEAGNTGAALNKLKDVLEDLEEAEEAGDLDLTALKAQLALIAKAVAVETMAAAEAVASSPGELKQVARANDLLGEGNDLLAAEDYIGAVDRYQATWQKAMTVLG